MQGSTPGQTGTTIPTRHAAPRKDRSMGARRGRLLKSTGERPAQQPAITTPLLPAPPRRTPVLLTLLQARAVPPPLSSLPPARLLCAPQSPSLHPPPSQHVGKHTVSRERAHSCLRAEPPPALEHTRATSHSRVTRPAVPPPPGLTPRPRRPAPAGRRPLQHTGKGIRLAPTSILAAPPGTRPRGLVPPHPPLPRRPLQENRSRKEPRRLLEAHHVKRAPSPPGPPNLPPQTTIPTRQRPGLQGSQAAPPRLPGLCAALGGHSDALCWGPAHPGLLATPSRIPPRASLVPPLPTLCLRV